MSSAAEAYKDLQRLIAERQVPLEPEVGLEPKVVNDMLRIAMQEAWQLGYDAAEEAAK